LLWRDGTGSLSLSTEQKPKGQVATNASYDVE
jgi:hypothetical protein